MKVKPIHYSPEMIEFNKRRYKEIAMKMGAAARTAALLFEAAEIISQLQAELAEARKQSSLTPLRGIQNKVRKEGKQQ